MRFDGRIAAEKHFSRRALQEDGWSLTVAAAAFTNCCFLTCWVILNFFSGI
jgi:hypothetical protein